MLSRVGFGFDTRKVALVRLRPSEHGLDALDRPLVMKIGDPEGVADLPCPVLQRQQVRDLFDHAVLLLDLALKRSEQEHYVGSSRFNGFESSSRPTISS